LFPLKDDIPPRRFPVLTVAIIALNVVVFFAFQLDTLSFSGATIKDDQAIKYGAIPYELAHPGEECVLEQGAQSPTCPASDASDQSGEDNLAQWWVTIFTSMFMHGGLLHLLGNMLFLWIFGNNIEDSMGKPRFVAFYLLGGVVALAAQTVIEPSSAVPTIGASGAVAAVLGGYALLYPRARITTLLIIVFFATVIQLPALAVLGLWFVMQLVLGAFDPGQFEGGGVAYFAHIGGFLFGMLVIKLFANRVHEDYEAAHRTPVY
jgi:membrane associated rhomboid family serine protease